MSRLLGDDSAFSLQHRLANGLMFVVATMTLLGAVVSAITGVAPASIGVSGVTGAVHVGLYLWARRGRAHVAPTWCSLMMLSLVFYPAMWFSNYGAEGAMQTIGMGVILATMSVLSGWRRNSVVALAAVVTVALFFVDFRYPGLFGSYSDRGSRYLDILLTTALVASALACLVVAMQSSYNRERERTRDYAGLVARTNRELEEALAKNHVLAHTDQLTQLPNRRGVEAFMSHKEREAERYDRPLSLAIFDVDHFKVVNDTFGHATGDQILVELAQLTRNGLRESDLCARWGGEEFLLLCPETSAEGALTVAERLRRAVEVHAFAESIHVTISVGLATFRRGDSIDALFARADQRLYEAKRAGRNCVVGQERSPAQRVGGSA